MKRLVVGPCLPLLWQEVLEGGWETGRSRVGGAPCAPPVGAKPTKLAQVCLVILPTPHAPFFPALPKAAQLYWLKSNLPKRLLQGQLLAGSGLILFLQPAQFRSAPVTPPGSTNPTNESFGGIHSAPSAILNASLTLANLIRTTTL